MRMRTIVVALVVIIAVALTLGVLPGQAAQAIGLASPSSLDKELAAFEAAHGSDFIWYNDSNNSFSMKYPVGYQADLQPEEGTYLQFSAFNPLGASELVSVYIWDSLFSRDDFESNAKTFPLNLDGMTSTLTHKSAETINGREAYFFYISESLPGAETLYATSAVINCGAYSANIVATIPQSAYPDRFVAEYMIRSFRC